MKGNCIKVFGKVQGVGFRYYTQKKAKELSINGFVKNMRDGSVYAEAEGSEENMDAFVLWINNGPVWARVDEVSVQIKPLEGFEDFDIR